MIHIRDQFGEPLPGVAIAGMARRFSAQAITDGRGQAKLTLMPVKNGIKVRLAASTYRIDTIRIR